jgi:hypothetical protein
MTPERDSNAFEGSELLVVTGLVLIAAGIGIELFAGASLSVSRSVGDAQAKAGRQRGVPRFYQRVLNFNAESGSQLGVWLGRVVGVAAIVAGIIFVILA